MFIEKYRYENAGLITITKVNVSDNLRHANIFLSFIDNKDEPDIIIKKINSDRSSIRYNLSRELTTKYTPEISISHDSALIELERINQLIKKTKSID